MPFYLSKSDGAGGRICGCASAEPECCCMYPAGFPSDTVEDFDPEDIPDAVDLYISGAFVATLNRADAGTDPEQYGFRSLDGVYEVVNNYEAWQMHYPGTTPAEIGNTCLFGSFETSELVPYEVRDRFHDVYNVHYDDGYIVDDWQIVRLNQCCWYNPIDEPLGDDQSYLRTWVLCYRSPVCWPSEAEHFPAAANHWSWSGAGEDDWDALEKTPGQNQSSPEGTYGSPFPFITVTPA